MTPLTNLWWTKPAVTERDGLMIEPAGDSWHVSGIAGRANVLLGAWITLDEGDYTLTAESSDPRVRATLGTQSTTPLDSTDPGTIHLSADRYLAYIRVTATVGDTVDATITPVLALLE